MKNSSNGENIPTTKICKDNAEVQFKTSEEFMEKMNETVSVNNPLRSGCISEKGSRDTDSAAFTVGNP